MRRKPEDPLDKHNDNRATPAGEALRRFHDAHSPLGRVRRIDRSDNEPRVTPSLDPFENQEDSGE